MDPRDAETLLDDAPAPLARIRGALERALAERAEHLHVEPTEDGWRLRRRHDDGLAETRLDATDTLPDALALLERRLDPARAGGTPAAFTLRAAGERQLVALTRVDTPPGSAFVLSLRGGALAPPRLDALGLDARQLVAVRELLRRPHGWLAVGAAGTLDGERTVRALAQELVSPERKLVALEPPLHPPLARTVQLPADTAPDALAALDPDAVLLVASVPESTLRALAARASGELLVVQRASARRPSEVLGRLLALGLAPAWLALALPAVLMRHRVHVLCPACRVAAPPDCDAGHWLGARRETPLDDVSGWLERTLERRYRAGPGCAACDGAAHAGTLDVSDVMVPDSRVRAALLVGDVERALAGVDAGTTLAPRLSALVANGTIGAEEAARHLRARY